MYALITVRSPLESVELRRGQSGPLNVWVRSATGIAVNLELAEVPWLVEALQACLAKAETMPTEGEEGAVLTIKAPEPGEGGL